MALRIALLIALGAVSSLMAASLGGKWYGHISANDVEIPVYLRVKQGGGKISGSIRLENMAKEAPLENAKIRADALSFEMQDDLNRVTRFQLKLADSALTGETTIGTEVSKTTLTRSAASETDPKLIHKAIPEYSAEARAAKVEGSVLLYAEIAPDGTAKNVKVLRSAGFGLDEKAIECVKMWKFKPGQKEGKPVTVGASFQVSFRLM